MVSLIRNESTYLVYIYASIKLYTVRRPRFVFIECLRSIIFIPKVEHVPINKLKFDKCSASRVFVQVGGRAPT